MSEPTNSDWSLDVLQCPITGEALSWASDELLELVNQRIANRELMTGGGEVVTEEVQSALINASQTWLYRQIRSYLDLLSHDAIELTAP